jgi:hypothetical protein
MDDDRIDFSSLDPSQDAARWEALADAVAGRAIAARGRSATLPDQLAAWWRPALAAAAVIAIAVWASATRPAPDQAVGAGAGLDRDAAFAAWAIGEDGPSAWEDVARAGGGR